MHLATLQRHSDLFRAATFAFSQVIPIFNKTVLVGCTPPFCTRTTWTSQTLEPPSATLVEICAGDLFVTHVQASGYESSFTEYVIHTALSSSGSEPLTSSFVTLSFQEILHVTTVQYYLYEYARVLVKRFVVTVLLFVLGSPVRTSHNFCSCVDSFRLNRSR